MATVFRTLEFRRPLRLLALIVLFGCVLVIGVLLLPTQSPQGLPPRQDPSGGPLSLAPGDRVLILSPHPDDDVLACAGIIQKALRMKLPLRVVFLTCGDANEWSFITYSHTIPVRSAAVLAMGVTRHNEAIEGESRLGDNRANLVFLGYPDHGTLSIFTDHWRDAPSLRSIFSRVTAVPYSFAMHPGAPYKGESINDDLSTVIKDFNPTCIFVSHPVDRNVDHRALYLFTRVALWHLPQVHATLHSFLVHTPGWPEPEGLHEALDLHPPPVLRDWIDWLVEALSPDEIQTKEAALQAHATQMSYSAKYLQSFVRKEELFGELAEVDVRRADGLTPAADGHPLPSPGAGDSLFGDSPSTLGGHEWRFARVKDGCLQVSLVYARPIAKATRTTFEFCPDRADRRFADMPKLSITADPFHVSVRDQARTLARSGVTVVRVARRTTVSVPLSVLGNPQHVLFSATSVLGEMGLDDGWWAVLEVKS